MAAPRWDEDIIDALRYRKMERTQRESLQLHRAQVLKDEGAHFFAELLKEAGRGIKAIAKSQGIDKDVRFETIRPDRFSAANTSNYPIVSVECTLSPRRIILTTKTRTRPAEPWRDARSTIEMCVRDDDNLYLCCEGEPLAGLDDVLKLIVRPLFHL